MTPSANPSYHADPSPEPVELPARGPWPWRYVSGLLFLLLLGVLICVWWAPVRLEVPTLVLLVVLSAAAEVLRRFETDLHTSLSFSAVVLVAAIPLVGPVGAALVVSVPPAVIQPRHTQPIVRAFNVAQAGLIGLVGACAYLAAGGVFVFGSTSTLIELLSRVLLPLLLASLLMMLLNAALIAGILRLAGGTSLRWGFLHTLRDSWVTYLGYGLVGFLFVVLWQVEKLGPLSLLLVVAPLMLAQWSISGLVEERETQLRTVRTLVAAVETRGAQRRGQGERVGEVCEAIGEQLGLTPRMSEALQFAAALHNVGLIAPPERGDARTLTPDRARRIAEHPTRGVEMLQHIDFLEESRSAILHHHERWDGHGYPLGLAAERIPLLARIVAVADVYVALTWGRDPQPPEQALEIVDARAGTHLDPRCVAALRAAWDRGRIVDRPRPAGPDLPLDHDAPEVSDLMASGVPR